MNDPVSGLEQSADAELIYQALRFYFWAAGQGISPDVDQDALEPEEGFFQYSLRTDDEDWETVAERYRAANTAEQPPAPQSMDDREDVL